MVLLMEELWELREYKLETFYLSVSIADHYLMKLAKTKKKAPCLATLGLACLFLAAKLEQPKEPNLRALLDDL